MKQPVLGKKISELRLAKGLTQSELAKKCQLSLRTIQRIEAAEVMPRSYTIKLIFENLDYEIYNSFGKLSYKLDSTAYKTKIRLEQFYQYVLDLFNLKTNAMKKITILSVSCIFIICSLLMIGPDTKAQNKEDTRTHLNQKNSDIVRWFNSGQIDSIANMYLHNACLIPDNYREIHHRENILAYYQFLYDTGFRFSQTQTKKLIITDSIAIDRGIWLAQSDLQLSGTYLTQWRLFNGKWYIENEMSNADFIGQQ
ncbi:MAG: helix-turn-helix domain-containing protein [Carboxylicivirga sp.]|jgi:transcriptional regulator with XRE-family HTH domain|nr:helix-turn-helix domain-containing protein [Carboxylicivirga sp.]